MWPHMPQLPSHGFHLGPSGASCGSLIKVRVLDLSFPCWEGLHLSLHQQTHSMELSGGPDQPSLSQQGVGLLTGPSLLPEQPLPCTGHPPGPPPATPVLSHPSLSHSSLLQWETEYPCSRGLSPGPSVLTLCPGPMPLCPYSGRAPTCVQEACWGTSSHSPQGSGRLKVSPCGVSPTPPTQHVQGSGPIQKAGPVLGVPILVHGSPHPSTWASPRVHQPAGARFCESDL